MVGWVSLVSLKAYTVNKHNNHQSPRYSRHYRISTKKMDPDSQPDQPPIINYILSFLLVGLAWGFTTPFIRKAAKEFGEAQERRRRQGLGVSQSASASAARNRSDANDTEMQGEQQGEEHEMLLEGEFENNELHGHGEEDEGEDEDEDATIPTRSRMAFASMRESRISRIRNKIVNIFWTVVNLLATPSYLIPLVLNLTGSVWFFLLIGKHGMYVYIYIYLVHCCFVIFGLYSTLSFSLAHTNSLFLLSSKQNSLSPFLWQIRVRSYSLF